MNRPDLLIAIAAIYGAILSTINFIVKIIEKKRKIKVTISIVKMYDQKGYSPSPDLIQVQAVNYGNKDVNLDCIGFILPNNGQIIPKIPNSNISFPCRLKSGENCAFWEEAKVFAKKIKDKNFSGDIKIKGFFKDPMNKTYKSKNMKFNIDRFLEKNYSTYLSS